MSRGIDYGRGLANIDPANGIRYGVISQHSVMPDALSDIFDHGDDLTYAAAVDDAKARIGAALEPVLDDLGVMPYVSKYAPTRTDRTKHADALAAIVDDVWTNIEQDYNDGYESDGNSEYRYEVDGYLITTSSLGLFILKSPFYTHAAYCSPCAPGAGDLDSPVDDGERAYCLGPDWFDDGKAPYRLFRVADNTEVFREDK